MPVTDKKNIKKLNVEKVPKIKKKRGRKPKPKSNTPKVKKKRGRKPKFHYNVKTYQLYEDTLFMNDKKFKDFYYQFIISTILLVSFIKL